MNYWPAYQTNLAECGSVFTDYMESLVQPGRVTAEKSAAQKTEDVINTPIGEGNGFLVNTQNNPFGCTAPFGSQEYGWNVTGSSWAMQNVYDQYLYTQDKQLLEDTIYPMLNIVRLSFFKGNALKPLKQFVGLDNYRQLFFCEKRFSDRIEKHGLLY